MVCIAVRCLEGIDGKPPTEVYMAAYEKVGSDYSAYFDPKICGMANWASVDTKEAQEKEASVEETGRGRDTN